MGEGVMEKVEIYSGYRPLPGLDTKDLTKNGIDLIRAVKMRYDQLIMYATTFEPGLWNRIETEQEKLVAASDQAITLEDLADKGIKTIDFTWGRVLFSIPIKGKPPAYRQHIEKLNNYVESQVIEANLLGVTEETPSRIRLPDNRVFVRVSFVKDYPDAITQKARMGLPEEISLLYMTLADESVYSGYKSTGHVAISKTTLLSLPSPENATLYWLFRKQADELNVAYISRVKEIVKEKTTPETIAPGMKTKSMLIDGNRAISDKLVARERPSYKTILENIVVLLADVNFAGEKLLRKPEPRTMKIKGLGLEVEVISNKEGVYMHSEDYRRVFRLAEEILPGPEGLSFSHTITMDPVIPKLPSFSSLGIKGTN